MPNPKQPTPMPFIRWAGGKRWLLKHIDGFLPPVIKNYHEPFLGGGSIFWHLKNSKKITAHTFLSDSNDELINCYDQIQHNHNAVVALLRRYRNEKDFYYEIRSMIPENKTEQAARFLFLNATSYNGIYRVNREGRYNVPFGYRKKDNLFDFDNLRLCNTMMDETVHLRSGDFSEIRHDLEEGDFVFLDPPYTVAHENNGFIQYNQRIFSWNDQERLAELLQHITDNHAFFVLTNAAHGSIENLFGGLGELRKLQRHSTIGGRGATRDAVNEYIFTNI
jgi:DNA adenine methylase